MRYQLAANYRFPLVFWLGGAGCIALAYGAIAVSEVYFATDDPVQILVVLILMLAIPTAALVVWGWLVWRGSGNSCSYTLVWRILARLTVVALFVLQILACLPLWPFIDDLGSEFAGDPQWGTTTVETAAGGTIVEFIGPITRPSVLKFEAIIQNSAGVRAVGIDSKGGRTGPARRIRDMILTRRLDTLVYTECDSACTIIFSGGQRRLIAPGARIGLHRPFNRMGNARNGIRLYVEEMLVRGVSTDFLVKVLRVDPKTLWFPSQSELIASGLVTGVVKPNVAK